MSYSHTAILGRLVADPQLRDVSKDTKVVSFTVANSEVFYTKEKEKKEDTAFIDCEMFGKRAEVLAQHFTKGSQIFVSGRLKQDRWEDKTSGEKRSKLVLRLDDWDFVGSKSSNEPRGSSEDKEPSTEKATSKKKERTPF